MDINQPEMMLALKKFEFSVIHIRRFQIWDQVLQIHNIVLTYQTSIIYQKTNGVWIFTNCRVDKFQKIIHCILWGTNTFINTVYILRFLLIKDSTTSTLESIRDRENPFDKYSIYNTIQFQKKFSST